MADPLLVAHAVGGFQLELGGKWWPVSIRDQMVRAEEVVRRAHAAGLIGGVRELLIIGAGAAGACAAVTATGLGVRTVVIDKEPVPFGRQAMTCSRWIDPSQYDWPLPGWARSHFPRMGHAVMPWRAARVPGLVAQWLRRYPRHGIPGILTTHYQTVVHTISVTPTGVDVTFKDPLGWISMPRSFGLLLSTIGFGAENVTCGAFRGWQFWERDPLERLATISRVVISGAGDGGLQDFLRAVTGLKSAAEIASRLPLTDPILEDVAIVDHAMERHYVWSDGSRDHSVLADHTARLRAIALRALGDPLVFAIVEQLAVRRDVTLVYPCDHFPKTYTLNAFLVLLFAGYLESTGKTPLVARSHLDNVTAVGAHPCGNPNTCYGQFHTVSVRTKHDCRNSSTGSTRLLPGMFDVVVIRHGVSAPVPVAGGRLPAHTRQVLPGYPIP